MKHSYPFSACLIRMCCCLLCLSACKSSTDYPAFFAEADSLALADPDRAVALLSSQNDAISNAPQPVLNYYRLLCIKADDNAHIKHTSDSLVKTLVNYYENGGDKQRLPEVYYYAGRVLRDMADEPQAAEYFQKALKVASKDNDIALIGAIYRQMITILQNQKFPDLALEMTQKAYECDKHLEDNVNLVYDLENMATLHWKCLRLDSAEFYYKIAISRAEAQNNTLQANLIKGKLGHLYINLGRYDEVEDLIRPYLNQHQECNKYKIYSITAQYFLATQQWDSASFYYEKSFLGGDIYVKKNANWGLAQVAFARNNLDKGQYYLAQYDLCLDSILKITSTRTISQTHFGYNYELQEKENKQLNETNTRNQRYLTVVLIILGTFLTGGVTYILYKKRKKNPASRYESETPTMLNTSPNHTPPTAVSTSAQSIEKPKEIHRHLLPPPSPQHRNNPDKENTESHQELPIPELQKPIPLLTPSELHIYLLSKTDQIAPLTEYD